MTTVEDVHGVGDLVRGGLEGLLKGDTGPFLAMFADDGAMEFPFGPPGYPRRVGPKTALVEYFKDFTRNLRIDALGEMQWYFTRDPDVAILEFSCRGTALQTGRSYDQSYVSIITLREGRIVTYRDYWNPLVGVIAMGGLEAVAHMAEGAAA